MSEDIGESAELLQAKRLAAFAAWTIESCVELGPLERQAQADLDVKLRAAEARLKRATARGTWAVVGRMRTRRL